MNKLTLLTLLLLNFSLANCSTMIEVMSNNDTSTGYRKKGDGSGKYVRQRVVSKRDTQSNIFGRPNNDSLYDNDRYREREIRPQYTVVAHSVSSPARSTEPSGIYLGISNSVSDEDSNFHLGMEAEAPMAGGWVMGRLGMSVFKSDYLYAGGTLGARVVVPRWRVSPYVGLEGYLGDHKQCEYEDIGYDEQLETCEKTFLGTLYTELGLRFALTKKINLYAFTRGYSKVDQTIREDLSMFYGASIFFTY